MQTFLPVSGLSCPVLRAGPRALTGPGLSVWVGSRLRICPAARAAGTPESTSPVPLRVLTEGALLWLTRGHSESLVTGRREVWLRVGCWPGGTARGKYRPSPTELLLLLCSKIHWRQQSKNKQVGPRQTPKQRSPATRRKAPTELGELSPRHVPTRAHGQHTGGARTAQRGKRTPIRTGPGSEQTFPQRTWQRAQETLLGVAHPQGNVNGNRSETAPHACPGGCCRRDRPPRGR